MHDLESETQSTFAAAAEPILKVVFNFFFLEQTSIDAFFKHAIHSIKIALFLKYTKTYTRNK